MPWLEGLKFPRGYQMGTHILKLVLQFSHKERNYRHGYGNKLYANDFA